MFSRLNSYKTIFQLILFFYLINFIFCEIEYGKELNDTCSANLQCLSGCCDAELCVETSKCKELRNKIYYSVAIVGIGLAIIFTIYLIVNLNKIRKDFTDKARIKSSQNPNFKKNH